MDPFLRSVCHTAYDIQRAGRRDVEPLYRTGKSRCLRDTGAGTVSVCGDKWKIRVPHAAKIAVVKLTKIWFYRT